LGALAVASAAAAQAQAAGPDGAVRRFEVAAIKVSPPGGGTMSQIYPGGRLVANGLTLKQLIRWSYGIQGFQISGGPDWAASERYFIDAKPDGLGGDSRASAFQMLRTLLAERFHLALERQVTIVRNLCALVHQELMDRGWVTGQNAKPYLLPLLNDKIELESPKRD